MEKYILSLDLGTTNIKAGIYNSTLEEISIVSFKISYINSSDFIEFDAEHYWQICKKCIIDVIEKSRVNPSDIDSISLTGQAETLVTIDKHNEILGNAISWMDTRSVTECYNLRKVFDVKHCYMITGQPEIVTTLPITKIMWMKSNLKSQFKKVKMFLLIKDYVIFRFTGKLVSEFSISSFTYYLDVINKKYWKEIIDYVGFNIEQLPELMEPGEYIVGVTPRICKDLGLKEDLVVNIGMLDHFSGMLGVGNTKEGILSESTGTVMALATILKTPSSDLFPLPFHYGPFQNKYSLLPVCESGGICYEWFRENFYQGNSFEEINKEVEDHLNYEDAYNLLFLPYIMGANSPEFNFKAKGIFYGININNKKSDFARAVLEGVAFLLHKNIDFLKKKGINIKKVISLGGGSKSMLWNQIKADVTGREIYLPKYSESALFGAAISAATRLYNLDYDIIFSDIIKFSEKIVPNINNFSYYNKTYIKFNEIYKRLEEIF